MFLTCHCKYPNTCSLISEVEMIVWLFKPPRMLLGLPYLNMSENKEIRTSFGMTSVSETVPMEVAETSDKRRIEIPDETWVASSSKRPNLHSIDEDEETKVVKFEDMFPEAFLTLSQILQEISVKPDLPFFEHLMYLIEVSKVQSRLEYSRVFEYLTVNDLLEMNNDAWVDYLAHPALLACVADSPRTSNATDKYVSLLSDLRCVLAKASAMTAELAANSQKEENLNAEIGRCRDTILRQDQMIKNQEALFHEVRRRSIYSAFMEVHPADIAKINEVRLLILKEFVRSKLACDCANMISQQFFRYILLNFKRQICTMFEISIADPKWENINPWLLDSGVPVPNLQVFNRRCEDLRTELIEFVQKFISLYPTPDID